MSDKPQKLSKSYLEELESRRRAILEQRAQKKAEKNIRAFKESPLFLALKKLLAEEIRIDREQKAVGKKLDALAHKLGLHAGWKNYNTEKGDICVSAQVNCRDEAANDIFQLRTKAELGEDVRKLVEEMLKP